jgi:hypothetical protein
LIFSWFQLANLWLTFSIVIGLLPNPAQGTEPTYLFGTAGIVSDLSCKNNLVMTLAIDALGERGSQMDISGFPRTAGMMLLNISVAYLIILLVRIGIR